MTPLRRTPTYQILTLQHRHIEFGQYRAGLVGGEGFAVDVSLIVADANKQRSTPGPRRNKELDAEAVSRATKEYHSVSLLYF